MKKIILLVIAALFILFVNGQSLTFELVKDINPDRDSSPSNMCKFKDRVYFAANDGASGAELWVSDGTEEGTVLLKDINPGEGNSNPERFLATSDKLYFVADDGTNGAEFWVTDGTEANTYMIKDINPNGGSFPFYPVEYEGKVIFRANNGTEGDELWITDGTEDGTYMILDIREGDWGSNPAQMCIFNGKIYFHAINNEFGGEIWYTDGTADGTQMLKDINPDGWSMADGLYVYNDMLYFSADDGTHGTEIWASDGTADGTYLIKDVNEGTANSLPGNLIGNNGEVYFTAYTADYGRELWKTDGTPEGTKIVIDLNEGTADGTFVQFDICVYNGKVIYTGTNNEFGGENFVTDGTAEGTYILKDIYPGNEWSMSRAGKVAYYVHEGNLFFRAIDDLESYYQLYISDGTAEGTYMISPDGAKHSNAVGYNPDFASLDNELLFKGDYSEEGIELWKVITEPNRIDDLTEGKNMHCWLDRNNMLHVVSKTNIDTIQVYTINGSMVYLRAANSVEELVNLSGRSEKIFIVKVQSGNKTSTFKILSL